MIDLVVAPWTAMACMGPEFWYIVLEVREIAPNLDTVGRSPNGMRSSSPVSAALLCMSNRWSRMALLSTFWTRYGRGSQKLTQKWTKPHSYYNKLVLVSFSCILNSFRPSTSPPILWFITPLLEGCLFNGLTSDDHYYHLCETDAWLIVNKSKRKEQQQKEIKTEKVQWDRREKTLQNKDRGVQWASLRNPCSFQSPKAISLKPSVTNCIT